METGGHLGIYGLNQGNLLQIFKNHSQLPNIYLFYYLVLVHFLIISRTTPLLFVYIQFSGVISKIFSGKCWILRQQRHETGVTPGTILKITHSYLIFIIIMIFWLNFSSFQGQQSWYWNIFSFFLSENWGSLVKMVIRWGSYILKQGNHFQNWKNNSQPPNMFLLLLLGSLSYHFKVYRVEIWLFWSFYGVRGEVLWG